MTRYIEYLLHWQQTKVEFFECQFAYLPETFRAPNLTDLIDALRASGSAE